MVWLKGLLSIWGNPESVFFKGLCCLYFFIDKIIFINLISFSLSIILYLFIIVISYPWEEYCAFYNHRTSNYPSKARRMKNFLNPSPQKKKIKLSYNLNPRKNHLNRKISKYLQWRNNLELSQAFSLSVSMYFGLEILFTM